MINSLFPVGAEHLSFPGELKVRAIGVYLFATVWRAALGEVPKDPRMIHEKEITEVQTIVRKGDESE